MLKTKSDVSMAQYSTAIYNIKQKPHLQQFFSSLPSLQSGSPSQRHFLWIHSPEPHCISLGEHLAGGVGLRPQRSGDSSDWSWQSTSSSHSQLLGMQVLFPQGTSLGPQEEGAQSCSSLPSPQSSSPLQTKLRETQRPLAQVNSRGAHVMLPKQEDTGKHLKWPSKE